MIYVHLYHADPGEEDEVQLSAATGGRSPPGASLHEGAGGAASAPGTAPATLQLSDVSTPGTLSCKTWLDGNECLHHAGRQYILTY